MPLVTLVALCLGCLADVGQDGLQIPLGGTAARLTVTPLPPQSLPNGEPGPAVRLVATRARFVAEAARCRVTMGDTVSSITEGRLGDLPQTDYWLLRDGPCFEVTSSVGTGAAHTRRTTREPDLAAITTIGAVTGQPYYFQQVPAGGGSVPGATERQGSLRGIACRCLDVCWGTGASEGVAAAWLGGDSRGGPALRSEDVTRGGLGARISQVLQWRRAGDLWIPAVQEHVSYTRAARGEPWTWERTEWLISVGVDVCDPADLAFEPWLPDATFVYDEPAPEDAGKPLAGRVVGEDLSEAWSYLRLNWHPWRDQPVFLSEAVRAYAEQE